MKLHFGIFIMFLLIISCNSGKSEEPARIQPTLASCLKDAFLWFVENDEFPDTAYYYSISFHKDNEELCVWDDTLILIGKPNESFPHEGFKGYATIGGFKLLIFDEQNLGSSFYNQKLLKNTDLDRMIFSDTAYFLDVIVNDSVLQPRGCGVDGLGPFRIVNKKTI